MKTETHTPGNYNTDVRLWQNYGHVQSQASPMGGVSVTINRHGMVGNGLRIMAQFTSRRHASKVLREAGWGITRQLGTQVKTSLSARYVRR